MRYFRDPDSGTRVSRELSEAIMRLISEGGERTAYGLNEVDSTANVRSAGFGGSAVGFQAMKGSR